MEKQNLTLHKMVIIIGLTLLLCLYIWGHNVGDSQLILLYGLQHTTQSLVDIGLVVVLFIISGGIGNIILRRIPSEAMSTGERVVLESALGFGAVSLFAAIMGLVGLFNLLIWVGLIVAAIVLWKNITGWLQNCKTLFQNPVVSRTGWQRFFFIFMAVLIVFALLIALAPQVAWDALNYHLVVPQTYIEEGRILANLANPYFGYPQNFDILFGLLMMFGTDRAPAVLHLAFGVISLLGIYCLTLRFTSNRSATVAVLVIASSYSFWVLMGYAYVDLALMAYGVAVIIAILQWVKKDQHQDFWLVILAVLLGIAVGIKYTAGLIGLAVYGVVIIREPRKVIKNTLIFGIVGFIVFLPWFIKGLVFYENPIYPYLWGGPNLDSARGDFFGGTGYSFLTKDFWYHIPIQPLTATVFGIDRRKPYDFNVSVFLLTLPFFLLLKKVRVTEKAKPLLEVVSPMALIVLAVWMLLAMFTGLGGRVRYILITIPLAAILCGLTFHALEQWADENLNITFMVQALLIVSLGMGIYNNVFHFARMRVLEYHTGLMDEDAYLEHNLDIHYKMMEALQDIPAGSKVLFLWEPKTYYCPETITCIGDFLFDHWSHPLLVGEKPEEVLVQWDAEYDYILVYDYPVEEKELGYSLWVKVRDIDRAENLLFPEYFCPAVESVWTDDFAYTLYTFTP